MIHQIPHELRRVVGEAREVRRLCGAVDDQRIAVFLETADDLGVAARLLLDRPHDVEAAEARARGEEVEERMVRKRGEGSAGRRDGGEVVDRRLQGVRLGGRRIDHSAPRDDGRGVPPAELERQDGGDHRRGAEQNARGARQHRA